MFSKSEKFCVCESHFGLKTMLLCEVSVYIFMFAFNLVDFFFLITVMTEKDLPLLPRTYRITSALSSALRLTYVATKLSSKGIKIGMYFLGY